MNKKIGVRRYLNLLKKGWKIEISTTYKSEDVVLRNPQGKSESYTVQGWHAYEEKQQSQATWASNGYPQR